eukprot:353978-Chlamydomonas_euryale.AAC.3
MPRVQSKHARIMQRWQRQLTCIAIHQQSTATAIVAANANGAASSTAANVAVAASPGSVGEVHPSVHRTAAAMPHVLLSPSTMPANWTLSTLSSTGLVCGVGVGSKLTHVRDR